MQADLDALIRRQSSLNERRPENHAMANSGPVTGDLLDLGEHEKVAVRASDHHAERLGDIIFDDPFFAESMRQPQNDGGDPQNLPIESTESD